MKTMPLTSIMASSLFLAGCSVFGLHSEENPKYEVVASSEDIEVRKYAPKIIAKTTVEGEYKESQNKAFRILADYIFGNNKSQKDIAMTAPVLHQKEGKRIAMTTPVLRLPGDKSWTMAFIMPSEYKMKDLPLPVDERIQFEEIPERYLAVSTYSWLSSEEKNKKHEDKILNWLDGDRRFNVKSKAIYAGYDPPWTLPFSRTHEVMVEVEKTSFDSM